MGRSREMKEAYFAKLRTLMETYKSIFIVNVDNVSSNQMHQVRVQLRGKAVILMGKNTMIRRAIKGMMSEFPTLERFLPQVKGNIGFVFTNGDLKETRDAIVANKVRAPARAGAYAPLDVFVEPLNTGMEPGKTSFFQALNIPTKIARGTIEITSRVHIVVAGSRVGASEATLLNMLNISPFTYGMTVVQVFDQGNVFPPSVLDISEDQLLLTFQSGIKTIAAISLAANYPTLASITHSLVNSYKNLLAVAVGTEYDFGNTAELKERLANPEAFASAAAPAAAAATEDAAPAAEAAKPAEEEEESDEDMGFGLFD